MSRPVGVRAAIVAAAALLVLPSVAAATPFDAYGAMQSRLLALVRTETHRSGTESSATPQFDFQTGNGYRIDVAGFGPDVVIVVGRRHSSAATAYIARGTVSPARLEASFGGLGGVDMRFHPSGRVVRTKPQKHCKGPDHVTSRLGVFVGDVRFSGEGGYTSAHIHRAKGRVSSPSSLRCAAPVFSHPKGRGGGGSTASSTSHGLEPTALDAGWKTALDSTAFLALGGLGGKDLFLAASTQSEGSVAIVRQALAVAPARAFVFDSALTAATVAPPAPFSGAGSFQAGPEGVKAWTGSLAVSFPGAENTPLTGPQFKVVLHGSF